MAWVRMVSDEDATGKVQAFYRRTRERVGSVVPNIAKLQSLRPETASDGFDLYCQVMDDASGLGRRERILIATVVSKVNGCLY